MLKGFAPSFVTLAQISVLAFANVPLIAESPLPIGAEFGGPTSLGRIAGISRVAQLFQREPVS
jgi:hypothetical protein